MNARPCDTHLTGCPCVNDDPFANFSSEAPDPVSFLRMAWSAANPGINTNEDFWDVPIGVGNCTDPDAQVAEDCAVREAFEDSHLDQPLFRSSLTSCSIPCPDGGLFFYSIAAGAITSTSQAMADYLAQSICLYRAQRARRCAPAVATGAATDVEAKTATLNGTVNPNGAATVAFFEWGTTTAYGHVTPVTAVGAGNTTLSFAAALTGLTGGTTYHFRIVAVSPQGTSIGADVTFLKVVVSLSEFDFSTYADLTDIGAVCGTTLAGVGAFVLDGDITLIDLGFSAGAVNCGNENSQYGGNAVVGINTDAFWADDTFATLINLGFNGAILSITEDGFSAVRNDDTLIAGLYDPDNNIVTPLGDLGGGATQIGGVGVGFDPPTHSNRCINSAHQIAASAKAVLFGPWQACRYSGFLINVTPAFATPGSNSGAIAISESGAILGSYFLGGVTRCFFNAIGGAGASVDIGTFGGYVSGQSLSRNNLHATGSCRAGGTDRAFRWKNGSAIALIPLLTGQTFAFGQDVNSDGWVVGISDTKCWLYRPETGTVEDILTLFPATETGWTNCFDLQFVNDEHQIAGQATHNGISKFFVLTLA